MIILTMRARPVKGPLAADALQTLQDDSTAAWRPKAAEVPHSPSTGLGDSLWAVTAHLGPCPQIATGRELTCRSQPKRSMSMVRGMTLGMHQFAFAGGQ